MEQNARVDAYLAAQAAFARPILARVRDAMALACPDAVETMKWSRPFWNLAGKPVAMMSGFKAHVSFGVWRPPGSTAPGRVEAGWDRVTDLAELPDTAALAEALRAALATVAVAPVVKRERRAVAAAGGSAAFAAFAAGAQAEYVTWIEDAKRPETRTRRVADAAGWIAEGKRRNWKYERC